MSAEQMAGRLRNVIEEWPPGTVVWHKADGKRGVIVEYAIDCTGSVMIVMDVGPGHNWEKCCPHVLSATKISNGDEGDEWKEGASA